MGCIDEIRMRSTQFPSEFVQCSVPNEGAIWNIEHAVVRVEVFDGRAPPACITLAENFLKVPSKEFTDSLIGRHCSPHPASGCQPVRRPSMDLNGLWSDSIPRWIKLPGPLPSIGVAGKRLDEGPGLPAGAPVSLLLNHRFGVKGSRGTRRTRRERVASRPGRGVRPRVA